MLMTASLEAISYPLKQLFEVQSCADGYVRLELELCEAQPQNGRCLE
jgi:hypothetical protein